MSSTRTAAVVLTAFALTACGEDASEEPTQKPTVTRPASHVRMLAALRAVANRTAEEHHYQGDRQVRELTAEIERLGDAAPWRLLLDAGTATLRLGRERDGIALLTSAYDRLRSGDLDGGADAKVEVTFNLGVAWLRVGETENCCAVPAAESCILPLRDAGIHTHTEGSENAARYLLEVVETTDPNAYWHLASVWLLNLAHMTLGTWPDGVPAAHRLPERAFRAPDDTGSFPRFANIASALGLDFFDLSGSVIADDFDGDDDLDLVVSTWDTRGSLRFVRNEGDGSFVERAAGLDGLTGGLNLVQADYDNDGDVDFLVLRGAWLFGNGRHPNSLVRNEGDGTFTDVTFAAGLGDAHYPTQTAAWADYDLDGDLDLYVGNESSRDAPFPNQLFRNEGNGTFRDVAKFAGVRDLGFTKGVTWGDYDDDGDPDLYVSNLSGANRLYRNDGNGRFTDVARRVGVTGPTQSFPAWFWDWNNDGALDLWVACYGTGIGHLAGYWMNRPRDWDLARLYRGDGRGGLKDVAPAAGLTCPTMPMGANFGDVDGDGWLDVYLGTGNVYYFSLMPNVMYRNRGGEGFDDVTLAGGFGHLQKGHGVVFADLDHDGDVDVYEQVGGAYAGDGFRNALWENPGFDNRWLTVQLVGTRSNRSAIGARIRVEVATDDDTSRAIYRWVNSGGSFGANPLRQTIGLGDARRVVALEVRWPSPGGPTTQRFDGIGLDRGIRIVEGENDVVDLELEPRPFVKR